MKAWQIKLGFKFKRNLRNIKRVEGISMKIFYIDSFRSYDLKGNRSIELYMYHGYKLPAKGQDFIHTNFYGEPKKSPGELVKNIFNIDQILYPNNFVLNTSALSAISKFLFEYIEIEFKCAYYADEEKQLLIKAYYERRLFNEYNFLKFVQRFQVSYFKEKYFQIYFPNITALESKYGNVLPYKLNFGPLGGEYNETIKYDPKMFKDFEILKHPKGTFFSEKAFNIFWPLLNERYFYYRIYDI